jgi:O-antigen/teichoic acid export membrane protein
MNLNWLWSKLKDNHLEELVKGALGFLNLRVLGIGLANLFLLIGTRWYGAEVVGVYSICIAVLRIAVLYGKIGLDNALVRFIAEYRAKGRHDQVKQVYLRGVTAAVPCSIAISLSVYFSAPFMAEHLFQNPALTAGLRIVAVIIPPVALSELNAAYLRGLKHIKSYSFLLNVSHFLWGSIILAAGVSFLEKATAPVVAFAAATGLTVIASFILKARVKLTRAEEMPAEPTIRTGGLMKIAFPMLMTGSYSFFLTWTGTLVLGILASEAEVGVFNVVLKVAALLTFTLGAVNSIGASKFSECYNTGDMEGFKRITRHATRLIFWTTVPIGVILLAIPRTIIGIFGDEIKSGAAALIILIIGYFTSAVSGPVGTILNMTGHQMVYQKIVFYAAIINILLNLTLIPEFGINGAAVAGTVSMVTWNIASIIYIKRKFNILTLYIPFLKK